MDLVINIQGFRDNCGKFISKEVAVIAIGEPIFGHWIMTPPYLFDDLPEKSKWENNWFTRNYHGIEFDDETNYEYFALQLREITRQARYIYSRGQEKTHYLRHLLSRNIYSLEEISPTFKNLSEGEENTQRFHHGFRSSGSDKFLCALSNVCKLKRLNARNDSARSSESSYIALSHDNFAKR